MGKSAPSHACSRSAHAGPIAKKHLLNFSRSVTASGSTRLVIAGKFDLTQQLERKLFWPKEICYGTSQLWLRGHNVAPSVRGRS